MPEREKQPSFEERKAASPIHNSGNVDRFLKTTNTPSHLHKPFHELLIARGKYPLLMDQKQDKAFYNTATKITQEFEQEEVFELKEKYSYIESSWVQLMLQMN